MFRAIKLIFILVILTAGIASFLYWKEINSPASDKEVNLIFEIKEGEGVKKISQSLADAGLIKSKLYFEYYIWQNHWQNKLMAGEYKLSTKLTMKEIATELVTGDTLSKEKTILIKEGLNSNDIAELFSQAGMFSKDTFLDAVGHPQVDYSKVSSVNYPSIADYSDRFSFLSDKPYSLGYEGYLFPDTYRFYKNATAGDVLLKMLSNLDKKLTPEMRQDIKKQGKTVYEIMTMASLIEKEVRNVDDMNIVSGIFWNRIKNGQRLESCATLAYILGVNKRQYSIADTEIKSTYNTYQNYGLPPGPIANPGINAIKAAIYPADTTYNYFLTAPDGTTIYAKTFDEHVRNKDKYLK